jgi:hypothetical protein
MRHLACALAVAIGLSGCQAYDAGFAGINNYYSGELKAQQKNIQGTNDNAVNTWSDIGCAMPYGALTRAPASVTRAIIEICGAPTGVTMTWSQPQLVGTSTGSSVMTGGSIQIPQVQTAPVQAIPAPPVAPLSSASPSALNASQALTNAMAAKVAAAMQQH